MYRKPSRLMRAEACRVSKGALLRAVPTPSLPSSACGKVARARWARFALPTLQGCDIARSRATLVVARERAILKPSITFRRQQGDHKGRPYIVLTSAKAADTYQPLDASASKPKIVKTKGLRSRL